MAVFNKDKPDYLDDPRMKSDFDSLRNYGRDAGGADPYQMQNGYGLGGYGAGQNAMQMAQQRQQLAAQQQMAMGRGQGDYSMLGGGKVLGGGFNSQAGSNPSIFQQQNRGLGGQNGLPFDNANFPSLGSSMQTSQPGQSNNSSRNHLSGYGAAAMYGSQASHIREDDFTIEKEDFPALPGSQKHTDSASGAGSLHGLAGRDMSLIGSASAGTAGSIGSSTTQHTQHTAAAAPSQQGQGEYSGGAFASLGSGLNISGLVGASQSAAAGAAGSTGASTPSSMSSEARFGLAALLDIIRMTEKDQHALSLGTDLTGFGLNLNSAESLFPSFASPFTDQALTPDPQFRTPACYLMHPPSLKAEHLSKFQLETLFYMFYSMPKDILQACAAQELYRREWRFHGELKVWLKHRSPHELMQSHPSVMFTFFDVAGWETRLFTVARGPQVVQALLSEEEVRVKFAGPATS